MSVLKQFIFLSFIVPFAAFACSLEQICTQEEAFECLNSPNERVDHRICIGGEWIEFKCRSTELCVQDACVPMSELCEDTGVSCSDSNSVKHCTKRSRAKIEVCDSGLLCDVDACAQGKECCAAFKPCEMTVTRCTDLQNAETCTLGRRPKVVSCGEGFVCDDGACASGQNCCVPGEICKQTQNTCVGKDSIKVCVQDLMPSQQACGEAKKCESGKCVEDACANNRLDVGETAVDCGGLCAPCVSCRVDVNCATTGFCDSASGYVCSKRCRTSADCDKNALWDGQFCRGDGRCSPKVFETVWQLTNDARKVVLPFDPTFPKSKCDFQILWGDEAAGTDITTLPRVTDCVKVENRTHTYARGGTYNIKMIGVYDAWGAFEKINSMVDGDGKTVLTPNAPMLRSVISFGPVGLSGHAFYAATELRGMPKKDVPDASKLVSLNDTFRTASSFNGEIGHWDTSRVTSMNGMFLWAAVFNQPLALWNTSRVTDMKDMFLLALVFNRPLATWDTSNVTNMVHMFSLASVFNQPLGTWNVSNVTDMTGMFGFANVFDQNLSAWKLKSGVILSAIFGNSGMSTKNLCLLKAKLGEWLKQWVTLGKEAKC